MKKISVLLTLAACSFIISCNQGSMSATAKKNMEVNDAITKAYESGDFSKMKDYIAVDAVDHGGEQGDIVGVDNIIAEMKRYHAMMPDMKSEIKKTYADDEYVFTWSAMEGTMNGQQVKMTGVDIARFRDGKAVEHWVYMDPREMAQMMQQMAPAADTAKSAEATKPREVPPSN